MIIKAEVEIDYTPEDGIQKMEIVLPRDSSGKRSCATIDWFSDVYDTEESLRESLDELYYRQLEEERLESRIANKEIDDVKRS